MLEALLEESKPSVPSACAELDYLLYTPFRYPPHHGSRFRGYADPGIWYGAEEIRTSCAELGYWRWRFVKDSHGLERLDGVPHTLYQALARGPAVDLREQPFERDAAAWRDPADYSACQSLARSARAAGLCMIAYESVRDPEHGGCTAVLDCRAFIGSGGVHRRQSWFLTVDRQRASWLRAAERRRQVWEFVFDPE